MQQKEGERISPAFEKMYEKFILYKKLVEIMDSVAAYTQNQATDLAKALADGVIAIETPAEEEEKNIVQELFNQENISLIMKQELFYYGMLEKLERSNAQISQSSKFRIYHTIANIKQDKIYNKGQKIFINDYGVECIRSNDYKLISAAQLDQIVKYETIAYHTYKMGEKINFKYESIKKESENMVKLLGECLVKHISLFESLNYDLNMDEILKVACISKQACKYHDLGVFILLVYLVQSSQRLQKKGEKVQNIEGLLDRAIKELYKKYPPGWRFDQDNQKKYKIPLNNLQIIDKQKSFKKIFLKASNKQKQVEEIIMQQAKIAEKCQALFEELVKSTCLEKCISFKINLKYYSNNPNKRSLTRIKEKLFFNKDLQAQIVRNFDRPIKQILDHQQITYQNSIDEIIKKKSQFDFKITDLLRGKCIFFEISDIIQTVGKIKKFIKEKPHYQLKEVQSRFTNPELPISDVTLKIEINKEIIAQLQLSTEVHAPTDNFSHRIYELVRTKIFSKLKIVQNYYEEFKDDFNQLASKVLNFDYPQYNLSPNNVYLIKNYFKLDNSNLRDFSSLLQKTLEVIHEQSVVTDPRIQSLMLGIFSIASGVWHKLLGKIINETLKDNSLSSKIKSVLLSYFLNAIQLPKDSYQMQQLKISKQQFQKKIFMEEFIRIQFQIEDIFHYEKQNYKAFHRAQQLKQIMFAQQFNVIKLISGRFVINLIIQQVSAENIEKIREMFSFYYVSRNKVKWKDDSFHYYQKWVNAKLSELQSKIISNKQTNNQLQKRYINKIQVLRGQATIINAQLLLEKDETDKAQEILKVALETFKANNEQKKQLECEALLIECEAKQKDSKLDQCIKLHNKVAQLADNFGLQLNGVLYADAMWRISEAFWKQQANKYQKRQLLQSFTSFALRQMSRSMGEQFIFAMSKRWVEFTQNEAKQCQILENRKIKYARIKDGDVCEYISKTKWVNIAQIDLGGNNIGNFGCKYLHEAKWVNLKQIDLWGNEIGDDGCRYLRQANWVNITKISLAFNKIRSDGCKELLLANWIKLTQIDLRENQIGPNGCRHLCSANWPKLTHINLGQNKIGSDGCKYLLQANWMNLIEINLGGNRIDDFGCKHLRQTKWVNLSQINLAGNEFGDDGCTHLSQAKWVNLTQIYLLGNNISSECRQSLRSLFTHQSLVIS